MSTHPLLIATCVVATAMTAVPLAAQVTNVTQGTNFAQIEDAIDAANNGDEILVSPGTYDESVIFAPVEVWLHSSGGAAVTTIRMTSPFSVPVVIGSGQSSDLVIEGFTITRTTPNTIIGGGGIRTGGQASPTFIDCIIENCGATRGGGAEIINGSPTFLRCTFRNNTSTGAAPQIGAGGGAVFIQDGATPTFTECVFEDNETTDGPGGAVYVGSQPILFERCTFEGNTNTGNDPEGGALYMTGSARIEDCSFVGNSAPKGGAVHVDGSASLATPSFERCDFDANTGAGALGFFPAGAAVLAVGSFDPTRGPTFDDCTFTDNDALWGGGGALWFNASSPAIRWCDFVDNVSTENAGAIVLAVTPTTAPVLSECLFLSNASTAGRGGAIEVIGPGPGGHHTIASCRFLGNSAANLVTGGGGAIRIEDASATIAGCAFSGNDGGVTGGAISAVSSDVWVSESSFSRNSASGSGAIGGTATDFTISNSIFWLNLPGDINGNSGTTIAVSGTLGQVLHPGAGNLSEPPRFASTLGPDGIVGTLDDNLRLQSTSPCIDAGIRRPADDLADLDCDGNTSEALPLDLDGHARRVDALAVVDTGNGPAPVVDMGCYEFGSYAPGSSVLDDGPGLAAGGGGTPGHAGGAGGGAGGGKNARGAAPSPYNAFDCDDASSAAATSAPCLPDFGGRDPGGPHLSICAGAPSTDGTRTVTITGAEPGSPVVLVLGSTPDREAGVPLAGARGAVLAVLDADPRGAARLRLAPPPAGSPALFVRALARVDGRWVASNVVATATDAADAQSVLRR